MDVEILSRLQFALTACFHFLFPPISIGFALYIVMVEAMWLKTGDEKYLSAAKFFLKLFGMIFAVGVVTGIVMVFQFGTNWPVYSTFVGDVFGSPLAIEAVFAFFMESTFLAVALWGWDRVGKKGALLFDRHGVRRQPPERDMDSDSKLLHANPRGFPPAIRGPADGNNLPPARGRRSGARSKYRTQKPS